MTVYKDSHQKEIEAINQNKEGGFLHMKGKKIVSTLLALLLLASLPVSALAAEWDISNGDITVNAGSGG